MAEHVGRITTPCHQLRTSDAHGHRDEVRRRGVANFARGFVPRSHFRDEHELATAGKRADVDAGSGEQQDASGRVEVEGHVAGRSSDENRSCARHDTMHARMLLLAQT